MAENPRIEELRRRVQADPASIAFAALAEEFRRVGRNEEAIETCRTGLLRHPAYLSARVTLGRALIETGDYEGAREELETVLRSAPENLAAIRGVATINERLGHSSEMDPHLADMMKTMHTESIRVAALKPPPPPEPVVVPEPIVVRPIMLEPAAPVDAEIRFEPAPRFDQFQVESGFQLVPEFPPAPDFQSAPEFQPDSEFAPEPRFQAEPEFWSSPQPEPPFDAPPEPEPAPYPQPSFELNSLVDAVPRAELELDLSLAPPLGGSFAPDLDLGMMLEAEPEEGPVPEMLEAEPESAAAAGPNPEMLAALARLERFLGAIQSLRA
jgi:hypothetical protein